MALESQYYTAAPILRLAQRSAYSSSNLIVVNFEFKITRKGFLQKNQVFSSHLSYTWYELFSPFWWILNKEYTVFLNGGSGGQNSFLAIFLNIIPSISTHLHSECVLACHLTKNCKNTSKNQDFAKKCQYCASFLVHKTLKLGVTYCSLANFLVCFLWSKCSTHMSQKLQHSRTGDTVRHQAQSADKSSKISSSIYTRISKKKFQIFFP